MSKAATDKSNKSSTENTTVLVCGELLADKLPNGPRPGGAPFNFAHHLQQLKIKTSLLSAVGEDETGVILLKRVKASGLSPTFIQKNLKYPSGTVDVELDETGTPSYTIAPETAYDYIDFKAYSLHYENLPCYIYFGSLIQRTTAGRKKLHSFLNNAPKSIQRIYDMNLRRGCTSQEIIIPSLEQTNLLKLNDKELAKTMTLLNNPSGSQNPDEWVSFLMKAYEIEEVIVTCGNQGSMLFYENKKIVLPPSALKEEEVIDTVGAGDAFAAAYLAYRLNHMNRHSSLIAASALAEKVCTITGAIPDNSNFYKIRKPNYRENLKNESH